MVSSVPLLPVEPLIGGVQRGGQAGHVAGVVPQGDDGRDVGPQQLLGEAAVVAQQRGVGLAHVSRGHQRRPVEGEVEVADAYLADLVHLEGRERDILYISRLYCLCGSSVDRLPSANPSTNLCVCTS